MWLQVVPGQVRWQWCPQCESWSALEIGVYVLADEGGSDPQAPELVGTFAGCTRCDPDLFTNNPPEDP